MVPVSKYIQQQLYQKINVSFQETSPKAMKHYDYTCAAKKTQRGDYVGENISSKYKSNRETTIIVFIAKKKLQYTLGNSSITSFPENYILGNNLYQTTNKQAVNWKTGRSILQGLLFEGKM